MTKTEWVAISAKVNLLWPRAGWRTETVRAAEDLLLDLAAGAVMAAVQSLAAEGREFAPNPGQLRKRACELVAPAIPDADEAWSEVVSAMALIGSYGSPTWSHPAVAAAVETIGWRRLCLSEDSMADRAHFIRFYGSVRDRTQRDLATPPAVRELLARVAAAHALPAWEGGGRLSISAQDGQNGSKSASPPMSATQPLGAP